MFKSVEQANYYFHNLAFFNRHVGELVVSAFIYADNISTLLRSF
jgi:hypothetical protein